MTNPQRPQPANGALRNTSRDERQRRGGFSVVCTYAACLLAVILVVSCGDDGSGDDGGMEECELRTCQDDERGSETPCEPNEDNCRALENDCGVNYCRVDPTCTQPCPDGSTLDNTVTSCNDDEGCAEVFACGSTVICRDSANCLEEARCADGSIPSPTDCSRADLDCVGQMICGELLYCPVFNECVQNACDVGESPTTLPCSETENLCRELNDCATTFYCHCSASFLKCNDNETQSSTPCNRPAIKIGCRDVIGCNTQIACRMN